MAAPSTRLRVRVCPGARRSGRELERHGEGWKLRVAAPPEDGKANDAALQLLAARLGLARADLRLVSGRSGRDKIVAVTGIDEHEAARRLEQAS